MLQQRRVLRVGGWVELLGCTQKVICTTLFLCASGVILSIIIYPNRNAASMWCVVVLVAPVLYMNMHDTNLYAYHENGEKKTLRRLVWAKEHHGTWSTPTYLLWSTLLWCLWWRYGTWESDLTLRAIWCEYSIKSCLKCWRSEQINYDAGWWFIGNCVCGVCWTYKKLLGNECEIDNVNFIRNYWKHIEVIFSGVQYVIQNKTREYNLIVDWIKKAKNFLSSFLCWLFSF